MVIGIIIAVVVILLVIMFAGTYNSLVAARNQVRNAFSQMDVQMKNRADLIPGLVETVKGAAGHEKGTLEAVINARNAAMNAQTPEDKIKANNEVTSALNRLMVLVESYPQLKANENFVKMMSELKDAEEKIRFSRQFYNDTVEKYNTRVQRFPTNIVAGMFGFKEEPFFQITEAERVAPKVDFSNMYDNGSNNPTPPRGGAPVQTRQGGFGENPLNNMQAPTNTNTIANPVPGTTNNIDTFNNKMGNNAPNTLDTLHSMPTDNNANNDVVTPKQ